MTEKRFTDDGIEDIENQSFTDNLIGKTYWIDNGLDEIVELLNEQHEQIEQLKRNFKALDEVKCEIAEENEQLKKIRDVAFELAEKPTQHTLWKFRSFLKEYNSGR